MSKLKAKDMDGVSAKPKQLFIFDHIPKCAGMSLHALLKEHFPQYRHLNSATETRNYAIELESAEGDIHICGGHHVYGIHEVVGSKYESQYFTFLRDPLQVAYSFFSYNKNLKSVLGGSFIDYLYDNQLANFTNHLGGTLDLAMVRLDGYGFIGFTESMSSSVYQLGLFLGKEFRDIPHNNKTDHKEKCKSMDPLKSYFSQKSCDYELFNHYKNRFVEIKPSLPTAKRSAKIMDKQNEVVAGWFESITQGTPKDLSNYDFDSAIKSVPDLKEKSRLISFVSKLNINISDAIFDESIQCYVAGEQVRLNPNTLDSKYRFDAVYGIYMDWCSYPSCRADSFVAYEATTLAAILINSPYAQQKGIAIELAEKHHDLFPDTPLSTSLLSLVYRKSGESKKCLDVVEDIISKTKSVAMANEYIATYSFGLEKPLQEVRGLKKSILEPHHNGVRFLQELFPYSERVLLRELADENTLVIRSGPMLILEDLIEAIDISPANMSIMTSDSPPLKDEAFRTVYYFDGWFQPSADYSWKDSFKESRFETVILLCSSFASLNSLHNFINYLSHLKNVPLFAYPMSNVFTPKTHKSLIKIR
ncbi:protein of unknown function [Pseudodesulfovibrio profundus]|uniref:Sulfotransferase family protein n=1 Tax=Pseudodesulfovibrio profundus TaxID=57320 RepID=A0A2C8FAS4_9BACT|nr:hypothetical protein [Pseudodesulfovibrio profundus]SOB58986.1 protein of unknown function [Pseudodesulfovibrio profundus]